MTKIITFILLFVGNLCLAQNLPKEPEVEKEYKLNMRLRPKAVAPKVDAQLTVAIIPNDPWVLKNETPFKAILTLPEGVSADQVEFSAKDFVDPDAAVKAIKTKLRGPVGTHIITANFAFFVCTDQICQRKVSSREVSLRVEPPVE